MRRRGRLAGLVAAGWWLASAACGCAYAPARLPVVAPRPLPADLAARYAYTGQPREATIEVVRQRRGVRESLVRFPLIAPDFTPTEPVVEFEWFESLQPGRRPAILFNPILGGDYPLERGICRFFARRGFHVAMVHRKTLKISPEQPANHLELLLRQGVLRIRQVLDWMALQPQVDAERMGSFGISMGGMATVMAAAVDPRLRASVVVLAGGGIPDILVSSHDRLLTKPLRRYLAHHRMDRATLYRQLQEEVRTDPLRLAPYVDTRRLLLVIATCDRTIGTANALRLRRALRYPQTQYLLAGHYTAYFLLPYLQFEALRFFERHLQVPG